MSQTDEHKTPTGQKATIVVNGQQVTVPDREVTYDEVTKIAYPTPPAPDTRYAVTFRDAQKPKEGDLGPGGSVSVKKEGTIFNVTPTGKS